MTTTTTELQREKTELQAKVSYGSYTYGEKSAFRSRIKEINAELKAAAAAAQQLSPIPAAIAPLKAASMAEAERGARSFYDRCMSYLAEHDWDMDKAAPRPSSKMDKRTYREMASKRATLSRLVARDYERCKAFYSAELAAGRRVSGGEGGLNFVMKSAERFERFLVEEREAAAASFDAYVAKLSAKVGPCDAATVDGKHLWQGSTLTVTKGETVERWHTQQIINYSVLGNAYNQWPTRKLK